MKNGAKKSLKQESIFWRQFEEAISAGPFITAMKTMLQLKHS